MQVMSGQEASCVDVAIDEVKRVFDVIPDDVLIETVPICRLAYFRAVSFLFHQMLFLLYLPTNLLTYLPTYLPTYSRTICNRLGEN